MYWKTLKDNRLFFVPYLIVLLFITPFLLTMPKGDLHLMINRHHNAFFDIIFAILTNLGDGLFIIIPSVILLFYSLRHAAFLLTAYLSTGLVTQILKRMFFADMMRPSKLLKGEGLYLVQGVHMLSGRSFPSGHATSAFALFLCLALIIKNRWIKLLCFVSACMVAFSRVYLSQHFLIDITVGSLIGTIGTTALFIAFYRKNHQWDAWKIQKVFKHDRAA